MMRTWLFVVAVMAGVALGVPAMAAEKKPSGPTPLEKRFGLGVVLGEPTGISGKYWTGPTTALDGGVAWAFGEKSALHVHVDHLFHHFNLIKVEKGRLPVYYGLGARVKLEDKSRVGVRVPVGLEYLVDGAPLDIFVEVAPIVELIPATGVSVNGGAGIRYFFGTTATTGTGKSEKAP